MPVIIDVILALGMGVDDQTRRGTKQHNMIVVFCKMLTINIVVA